MQGHILKYKDKDGNWHNLPFTASDIYTLYCVYCKEHGVEPVSQEDYYISVGALSTLVAQLGSSTPHLIAISKSLENGALPAALGGTGLIISPAEAVYTLVEEKPDDWNETFDSGKYYLFDESVKTHIPVTDIRDWEMYLIYTRKAPDYDGDNLLEYLLDPERGAGLITLADVVEYTKRYDNGLKQKDILVDTRHPDEIQWREEERPKYYFQIEE